MSVLITAEQALNVVNDDQVKEFHAEFNKHMGDQKWVNAWRCGGEHESYWRFSFPHAHNEATQTEIRLQLDMSGWAIRNVNVGYDRGHYTCYEIKKA